MADTAEEESPLAQAPSELSRHCQFIDRTKKEEGEEGGEEDEDPWVFANEDESVES